MTPPTCILASTKPRHAAWTAEGLEHSILHFWSKVEPNENGCLIWAGCHDKHNYGRTQSPYWYSVHVHRLAWEMLRGRPAPRSSGLDIDHWCHTEDESCTAGSLCPHRPCVNIDHLREIPASENRSTQHVELVSHCAQGHPMFGPNLYVNSRNGERGCRECVRLASRAWLDKDGNRERQNAMRNARRRRSA